MNGINIVAYAPEYKTAFKALNVTWIEQYFKMEATDYRILDYPETYILDKGGYIGVALLDEQVVGVCALLKMEHPKFDLELAKMAVSTEMQGMGVGKKLAKAMIAQAKNMGAKTLYLESSTLLSPALHLYRTLGFVEIHGQPSPYERSDIQMRLDLD
ncbi:MAG: GNAT family N-acetyltransferase [Bacteroidota bacterium]